MGIREDIVLADDIQTQLVDVPEWGVKVKVRALTARQSMQWVNRDTTDEYLLADIVMMVTRDPETDDLVFDKADRDMLMEKSARALNRIVEVVNELSGLDIGEAEAEIEENPTFVSSSKSPNV